MARQSFKRWGVSLAIGELVILALLETRVPHRARKEPRWRHVARNLLVAGAGASIVSGIEAPVARQLGALVVRRRWGLVQAFVPAPLRGIVALIALDYSFYFWHRLTHRIPFLWRFHQVHHADRDLDISTAIRFHIGELALSVPWRAAQIIAIGVSPQTYDVWQLMTFAIIVLQHANVALPDGWDARINGFITTPRLHEIHHAAIESASDGNFSSGLSAWDRLHRTFRPQLADAVSIGLPAFASARDVTIGQMFLLPLRKQRPAWTPGA